MQSVEELARYVEAYADVIASRDGDDLVFWESYDDNGRQDVTESRVAVADYVAKGVGPYPWYDLRDRRPGALQVFDALGVPPPRWTEPLAPDTLELFHRASNGWASVAELLSAGTKVDSLDACGASPLWYAVRSLRPEAAIALIDAGADAGRRVELSARGDQFTSILHEIVHLGRTVALEHALARNASPTVRDSDGATPLHRVGEESDHVSPKMVRALTAAGADVDAETPSGRRPIEVAARRLLPATVAAMLDLGAQPARSLTAVLTWWAMNAGVHTYRAKVVADVVEILCAGGASATERDRELADKAGDSRVIAALGD